MLTGVALAVPSFFPASWFAAPAWRQALERGGIPTGALLSPQPWLSAEAAVLLLAGALWIGWLAGQEWEFGERRLLMAWFVAGAAAIAALALGAFYSGHPVPFWHSERGFGPFPNRNQTGDFFAVSGVLAVGCTCECFRREKRRGLLFLLASLLIGGALVTSYSRAAVGLFFAGSLVWVALIGVVTRSVKWPAVSASLLIVFAALFLLFGGTTLQRFQGDGVTLGFRRLIARDVFTMIKASPWCGIGLGNFEPVFAQFRNASAMPSRILHPESDWLWLWSEMGWPALLSALAIAGILFGRVAPLSRKTDRRLRLAAAAAAAVFLAHGLVDVPAHRLGSALPGLLMLGLALNRPGEARASRWVPVFFRCGAVVVAAVGAIWLWAVLQSVPLPGAIGASQARERAQAQIAAGAYSDAETSAVQGLRWEPLDWRLYFLRAQARAGIDNWPRGYEDFRRAALLETTSPLVTFAEGKIWMAYHPSLAITAWNETLRRCPPQEMPEYYSQMMAYVVNMPEVQRLFHRMAEGRPGLEIVYLNQSGPAEAKRRIGEILQSDPALKMFDDAQKTEFFRLWAGSGGGEEFMKRLGENPQWEQFAWRQAADSYAAHGDFEKACSLVFRFMPRPAMPPKPGGSLPEMRNLVEKLPELRARMESRPDDYAAGYTVAAVLTEQHKETAALEVVRKLAARKDCPAYFHYLEAELENSLGDFAAAWNALQKYSAPAGS